MRSSAPPGSPHGSDNPNERSGDAPSRPSVPYPTKELLRQDRENRDFIYNLGFAVSVLEDMIVKFETTTRAKLSELNNKAARLERLLTYVEFAVSGGAPVDAELPFPLQPASPVASVQANLSAGNSPVKGAAGGSRSGQNIFDGADAALVRAVSPSKPSFSPRHARSVVDQGKPSANQQDDVLPKSPKHSPGRMGVRSPSPTAGRHRLVDDDRLARSSSRHSSRSRSRRRGETDDVEEVVLDQHKVDHRRSPHLVRESYTVNSSFQDWRPPAAQMSEAEQVELRASRKDELVNMESDDDDDLEVTQEVQSKPAFPHDDDDGLSPRPVHQWHRTMDNALYESLAFGSNSLRASTASIESHGRSREVAPHSAALYSPLPGRSLLGDVRPAVGVSADNAALPVDSSQVERRQWISDKDHRPVDLEGHGRAAPDYQQAASAECFQAASMEYPRAASTDYRKTDSTEYPQADSTVHPNADSKYQQAPMREGYEAAEENQQPTLAAHYQEGPGYHQGATDHKQTGLDERRGAAPAERYQAAVEYQHADSETYHEAAADYHHAVVQDRQPTGPNQEMGDSSPSVRDFPQGFSPHAAVAGAGHGKAEGHSYVDGFHDGPDWANGSHANVHAVSHLTHPQTLSQADAHTHDWDSEAPSFSHHTHSWKPDLEQVLEEQSDAEGQSKDCGPTEEEEDFLLPGPPSAAASERQKPPMPRPTGILAKWRPPLFHPNHASTSRHADSVEAHESALVHEETHASEHAHDTGVNDHFDGSPLASQSSPIDPEGQSIPDVDGASQCHTPVSYDHSVQGRRDEDATSDMDFNIMLPLPHFLDSSPPPPSRASTVNSIWDQMAAGDQGAGSRRAGLPGIRTGESHRSGTAAGGNMEQYWSEHLQRLMEQEYASTVDESWADSESLSSPAPRVRMPLTASQGG